MKTMIEVQYQEKNVKDGDLDKYVKETLKEQGVKTTEVETLNIYYLPETAKVFFVAIKKDGSELKGELDRCLAEHLLAHALDVAARNNERVRQDIRLAQRGLARKVGVRRNHNLVVAFKIRLERESPRVQSLEQLRVALRVRAEETQQA